MLNRLSVQRKVSLVAAVPIAAMVVLGLFAFSTQQVVKVGGENYQRIVASKDLVADILPPPGFLVESYLTVQQLANATDSSEVRGLQNRLATFKQEYTATHQRWQADKLIMDDELRRVFLEDSFESATEFYDVVDQQFLPLIESGDRDAALIVANTELKGIYDTHRASIVETVSQAKLKQTEVEQTTQSVIKQRSLLTIFVFVTGLAVALLVAVAVARAISRSVHTLRDAANNVVLKLRSTDLEREIPVLEPVALTGSDELAEAAAAFNSVVGTTVELLQKQARGRHALSEMFVNLGRRNQNLVARQLRLVDELERDEVDSEALKKLFKLDHIATRMRRNAESLLVMAGHEAPRKWKRAVPVRDVLRSAVSEVEQYDRVEVLEIHDVRVTGGAAANLSHLVAELVENAVRYSPPDTPVNISTQVLTNGGLRLSIEDRGIGLTESDLSEANERLAVPQGLDEAPTAYLGHFVVSHLAGRHDIKVRLLSPAGEGVTAEIDLPGAILTQVEGTDGDTASEREGYVRDRSNVRRAASLAAPAVPSLKPVTVSADTPKVIGTDPLQSVPVAAVPDWPQTMLPVEPSPAQVTAAGYKKRVPKALPADSDGFDRFATPAQDARPRSAEAVRNRLDNFKSGKTRATVDGEPQRDNQAGAVQTRPENDPAAHEQGA